MAFGHFNNDDWADMAVADFESGEVTILLNDGHGTFPEALRRKISLERLEPEIGLGGPVSIVTEDLNKDGYSDLAVADYSTSDVAVILNKGDGSGQFPAVTYYVFAHPPNATEPESVIAEDFNGDAYPDLAVANDYTGNVSVLINKGSANPGRFNNPVSYPAGTGPFSVCTGQLNEDAYAQANYPGMIGGVDKAYLNGTTGDDVLIAVGNPHATISGVAAGNAQLTGTAYWIQAQAFQQVYADLKTGNDTANLYDSTGAGVEQFWGGRKLPSTVPSDAVLSDGTLDLANGNLTAALSYYFRVTGLDNNVNDHVNLYGSLVPPSGENHKHSVNPLDYVLAISGPWTDV